MSRSTLLKVLLVFVTSVLVSFSLQRFFQIDLETIQRFVTAAGIWAPLAYSWILFLGLTIPFNPISDSITVSIAALVFPPWIAVITTFFAHTLALSANYWLAREYGSKILGRLLSAAEVKKIEDLKPKLHPGFVFGLRFLLPLNAIGFDFISYAAGIARMSFRDFYISSIVPWTILNLLFFSTAGYLRNISPGLILLPIVLLVVLPGLYFTFRQKEGLIAKIKSFLKLK